MNTFKICNHFIVVAILLFSTIFSINAAEQSYISGKVTDATDGSPIAGASVMIGFKGVVTNADGYYSMPLFDTKSGTVTLSFSCVSYIKKYVSVSLPLKEGKQVNVSLTPDENMLGEAFVQGTRHDFGVKNPQMSAIELSGAQLKAVPMIFGEPDLLKTIQRLPGVQSGKEGNSGIMVRGGGYDQNQMMLDGTILYSTEHMKGFVTAVNPDVISSMAFFRGAFPSKYGGRLSSVIDVATTEGDYYSYHGSISAGLMIGRFNISGPIIKGKTSFSVAARASYFDMIFQPEAEKHYRKIKIESPYTGMEFWDVNLKLAHRFSSNDKLTFLFITDQDRQKTETTKNTPKVVKKNIDDKDSSKGVILDYSFSSPGENSMTWGNILSSLNWYHRFGERHRIHATAGFSRFNHEKTLHGQKEQKRTVIKPGYPDSIPYSSTESTAFTQFSKINNLNIKADYQLPIGLANTINVGIDARYINTDPRRHIVSEIDNTENWTIKDPNLGFILMDHRNIHTHSSIDSLIGKTTNMFNGNIYVSDDMKYGPFEAIIGARLATYSVKHKTYLSFEPRLSALVMLGKNNSIKASFSRISQGERLLSSTTLVAPSDIWVNVTDSVSPMTSMSYSMSYNIQLPFGLEASIEGYYKTMDNTIEYRDGADFSNLETDWEQMILFGKGKSYGVELLIQQMIGNTMGWISYTWSKAISRFDRPGQSINSGIPFYSPADCRNNLAINVNQRINFNRYPGNHLDLSIAFTYSSGHKYTVPDHLSYTGLLEMSDHYFYYSPISSSTNHNIFTPYRENGTITLPAEAFDIYLRLNGYSKKNNFQLPDNIRLDLTLSMTIKHLIGQSTFALGATNLLNRKNISDAFIGSDSNGNVIIKGICNFPIMPTLSYTYSF